MTFRVEDWHPGPLKTPNVLRRELKHVSDVDLKLFMELMGKTSGKSCLGKNGQAAVHKKEGSKKESR